MSLQDWQKNGWLIPHQSSPKEIADLFAVADRDLAACQAERLGVDWSFNIAYNSALQSATAALAAAGYRAERDQHHYRVIQSLALTLGLDATVIKLFDAFRKKRNRTGYERIGEVSDQEATEMVQLARGLRQQVAAWIKQNHKNLV
jgi:hypothetical protein